MGILDKFRSRSKDALDNAKEKHGDRAVEGVEKAGEFIDEKTGGKYRENIDQGVEKAKDALDDTRGDSGETK